MRKLIFAVFILALLAVVPAYSVDEWRFSSCDLRFFVELKKNSRWPADCGDVWLCLPADLSENPQVAVTDSKGQTVGSIVYWAENGEPCRLMFDTSSEARYYIVYVGNKRIKGIPAWHPRSGVMLETRKFSRGRANTLEEAQKLWDGNKEPEGRSLVDNVFLGINPHGPSFDFMARFRGAFFAPVSGEYLFATLSDDASFLLIDGNPVVDWPGYHSIWPGRRGEHNNSIILKKGRHVLEYLNIQRGGGFRVVAAWKKPGSSKLEVIGKNDFAPVGRFSAIRAESSEKGFNNAAFSWEAANTSIAGENSLVTMNFSVLTAAPNLKYIWKFDDGISVNGPEIGHTFMKTGLRTVKLGVFSVDGKLVNRAERTVSVHPAWYLRDQWNGTYLEKQEKEILENGFEKITASDLAAGVRFAVEGDRSDFLTPIGLGALGRKSEFSAEDADIFMELGLHFQHYSLKNYAKAGEAFAECVKLSTEPVLTNRARLHLLGLLIYIYGNKEDAEKQAATIEKKYLKKEDSRLLQIYMGDMALFSGDSVLAEKRFSEAGTVVKKSDLHYAARRRSRLESAKDYLSAGELEEAERLAQEIEWETPEERMGSETGLILAQVFRVRQEFERARRQCLRMLAGTSSGDERADILFELLRILHDSGAKDDMPAVYEKLITQHPYSEAAARALDKFSAFAAKTR